MKQTNLQMPGTNVSSSELILTKATALVSAVEVNPYTQLIECQKLNDECEVVVIDIDVELGQNRVNDIRAIERVAICIKDLDIAPPEVLALRTDFPLVPHLNLRSQEFPRSLCLFEEPYIEIKRRLTASAFLERIREWLAQTAKGVLHGEDQPLEPLLPYSLNQVVLPAEIFTEELKAQLLTVVGPITGTHGIKTFIAQEFIANQQPKQQPLYIALPIIGHSQVHGVIHSAPQTLAELHQYLLQAGIDLLEFLRKELKSITTYHPNLQQAQILLIVWLNKKRSDASAVEAADVRAFMLNSPLIKVGSDIGIWDMVDKEIGTLLKIDSTKNGQQTPIALMNPQLAFTPELAAEYNGFRERNELKLALVGVGALGSQLLMNLVRMGFGQWTVIDDDMLFPHNLAHHVLSNSVVGLPKASSVAKMMNELFGDKVIVRAIVENVLDLDSTPNLKGTLNSADMIVDASASISVARSLCYDYPSNAKKISLFLNPTGTDLVALFEGTDRKITLDMTEMQYYRGILHNPLLQTHLQMKREKIRYASSCRDISGTVSQDLIALHAALAAKAIQVASQILDPFIWIWQFDQNQTAINKIEIPVENEIRLSIGEWTLVTDEGFLKTIFAARSGSLPSETGGVLVGSYDMPRKTVYVVDTILSPPDSVEWPTVYIRGCQGLTNKLNTIISTTAGQLEYIGEWHSHPDQTPISPSSLDVAAFQKLAQIMNANGIPPLMLIAGENNEYNFFLETIERSSNHG